MRDIVLTLIFCGLIPMAIWRPWVGALGWVWVSLMSPHRMAYGFIYDAPVAQAVGLATMLGLLLGCLGLMTGGRVQRIGRVIEFCCGDPLRG